MPGRNKKTTKLKKKDMPPPFVSIKADRPFVKPTDPSWNPMEERSARTGWCIF
jgi:hypothetical protein